jgi:hypothetical protein
MSFDGIWGTLSVVGKLGMLVAVTTAVVGVACAVRADERRLALMRPLSLATIFAALCTFSAGAASVLSAIAATQTMTAEAWRNVTSGAAEMFVPLFGAFGCLTIAWILVAVGLRRG